MPILCLLSCVKHLLLFGIEQSYLHSCTWVCLQEWRKYPLFDNIFQLVGVPVITVQLRYDGWVTEMQDPQQAKQLGKARGIDNLLYRWGGTTCLETQLQAMYGGFSLQSNWAKQKTVRWVQGARACLKNPVPLCLCAVRTQTSVALLTWPSRPQSTTTGKGRAR